MGSIQPAELGRLFDRYAARLVLYARQWLDGGAAEDVVQEVFVRLAGHRRPDNPKAWLFRSVRNAAISHLRSRRRRRQRQQARAANCPAWFVPDPASLMDAAAAVEALQSLSQTLRELVVLKIYGPMSIREIAEAIDQPVSTVFKRYQTALEQLRKRMTTSCQTETN